MVRISAFVVAGVPLLACNLSNRSIGDEGSTAASGDSTSDDSGAGGPSQGDASSEPPEQTGGESNDGSSGVCTLKGCQELIYVTIPHAGLPVGVWTLYAVSSRPQARQAVCTFIHQGDGVIPESACNVRYEDDAIEVEMWTFLLDETSDAEVFVLLDGVQQGSTTALTLLSPHFPNGPQCEPCYNGAMAVALDEPAPASCEILEYAYTYAVADARHCNEPEECGQTTEVGTCGCTQAPVFGLDADLAPVEALWKAGVTNDCTFAQTASFCSCPEADGFTCSNQRCEWDYN